MKVYVVFSPANHLMGAYGHYDQAREVCPLEGEVRETEYTPGPPFRVGDRVKDIQGDGVEVKGVCLIDGDWYVAVRYDKPHYEPLLWPARTLTKETK